MSRKMRRAARLDTVPRGIAVFFAAVETKGNAKAPA
jgi:hypothetical protein